MSKQEDLQVIISRLRSAVPELRGALVATTDGLSIAHSFGGNEDPNRVAAMAATALGLGKRIADTVGAGTLTETSVSGADGQVFLYAVSGKGVLAVVAPAGVNVGLVHLEAREAARSVATVL
jgi:uncharacterized protein